MYYDNKRTFYIKQYGPTALVSVVVIALLTVGSILYFKNSTSNNLIASEPNEQVVDVAKKNETEPVKEKEEVAALEKVEDKPYFSNLETLVKSELVDVASVDNNGDLNLKYGTDTIKASMIGIDYKYATENTYSKIRSDLEGKQVKIAFDKQRDENDTKRVYVYLNNELYNAKILKAGLATLKSERTNVALATDLSKAQAYARDNKQGIWNK